MHGVGVAEEVVEISEDFLVGTDEKHTDVVGRAGPAVEGQDVTDIQRIDELVDLPVAVAGEVRQHAAALRFLVETMDGHDGEELAHRPVVWRGLEDRKVPVVGVRQFSFEARQVFGDAFGLSHEAEDLFETVEHESLHAPPHLEIDVPEREQGRGFLPELQDVVVGLLDAVAGGALPDLGEVS